MTFNGVELRNVVRFSGMEDDEGFNADIFINSARVGTAQYMADGGPCLIRFNSPTDATNFAKARFGYFKKNLPKDYNGKSINVICPVEEPIGMSSPFEYVFSDNVAFILVMLSKDAAFAKTADSPMEDSDDEDKIEKECAYCNYFRANRQQLISKGNGMYEEVMYNVCPVCASKL